MKTQILTFTYKNGTKEIVKVEETAKGGKLSIIENCEIVKVEEFFNESAFNLAIGERVVRSSYVHKEFIEEAEEPTTPTNEPTNEATTNEATEEATTEPTAPTFAEVVADYAAGTWESIKTRSRKAWELCRPAARRAAHILVCALFILINAASFVGVLWCWATVAGDIIPHTLTACVFLSIPSLCLITALWALGFNWFVYHLIPASVKDFIMYG